MKDGSHKILRFYNELWRRQKFVNLSEYRIKTMRGSIQTDKGSKINAVRAKHLI